MVAPASRILIVEDETLLAMDLACMLEELGFEVAGHAANVERAKALAEATACDAAVLDLNLSGESAESVADILVGRGIPVVFATGYGNRNLNPRFSTVPVVEKPYTEKMLEKALADVLR